MANTEGGQLNRYESLLERAAKEPLGVDISDYGDEWCAGFLRGQVNVLEELRREDGDALDAIANLDIDPQSPNSADWRATLVYAVTVARQAIDWKP